MIRALPFYVGDYLEALRLLLILLFFSLRAAAISTGFRRTAASRASLNQAVEVTAVATEITSIRADISARAATLRAGYLRGENSVAAQANYKCRR